MPMPDRRPGRWLLAIALSASACSVQTAPRTAARPSSTPSAMATATPGARAAGERLLAPKAGFTAVDGTLVVDAGYLVRAKLGQLISQDGGTAVYPAASLIGQDGATIVAQGGGNLISQDGGSLLASDGANLISQDGGTIVAQGGGNPISQDGGTYRLAEAEGGDRPAAAFVVRAISLLDNRPVPLGVDAKGNPAYAVLTDAQGGYQLYLPKALAGNVRLVASPAGSANPQATLEHLVERAGEAKGTWDEDASVASYVVRQALLSVFATTLAGDTSTSFGDQVDAKVQPLVKPLLDGWYQAAGQDRLARLNATQRDQLAQRMADVVSGFADLSAFPVVVSKEGYQPASDELAFDTIRQVFDRCREAAARKLALDPAYFRKQPYVVVAGDRRRAANLPPAPPILKASEICDFMVAEYASSTDSLAQRNVLLVLQDLGVPDPVGDSARLRAAYESVYIGLALAGSREGDPDPIDGERDPEKRGERYINDAVTALLGPNPPKAPPSPDPAALPDPGPTAPAERYVVGTLVAGQDVLDGPLAEAKVQDPGAMAAGGGKLFYVEGHGNLIRVIAQGAVTTPGGQADAYGGTLGALAYDATDGSLYAADADRGAIYHVTFTGEDAHVERLGQVAFQGPQGLALTADHALLVTESKGNAVRRLALDGSLAVTSLWEAGADGIGDATTLHVPWGIAVAPDGTIYVSDEASSGRAIVTLGSGMPAVLAGRGEGDVADGYFTNGHLETPQALALLPDGSLAVVDNGQGMLRRLQRVASGGGLLSTLAGQPGKPDALADGPGATAVFGHKLAGLAVASTDGKLDAIYVADPSNHAIRTVKPAP